MKKKWLSVFLLILSSACGSGSGSSDPTQSNQPGVNPSIPEVGYSIIPIPKEAEVSADQAFGPVPIKVIVGTKVIWINNDLVHHRLIAPDGAFDTGDLAPGDQFAQLFTTPGDHAYYCKLYPKITGLIRILPHQ